MCQMVLKKENTARKEFRGEGGGRRLGGRGFGGTEGEIRKGERCLGREGPGPCPRAPGSPGSSGKSRSPSRVGTPPGTRARTGACG